MITKWAFHMVASACLNFILLTHLDRQLVTMIASSLTLSDGLHVFVLRDVALCSIEPGVEVEVIVHDA